MSSFFTAIEARPDGKAVATAATAISFPPIKFNSVRAILTISLYTQIAPTDGTAKSVGSGLTAFAQSALTFPAESAPSRVVKSTILMAISIAQALLVVLILLVASMAALESAPT